VLNFGFLKVLCRPVISFFGSITRRGLWDYELKKTIGFESLKRYFFKNAQRISTFNFSFYFSAGFIAGPLYWDFRPSAESVLAPEVSPLTQTWCFLARVLNGIDPFDLSRWTPSSVYPKEVMREYVLAPEFIENSSE